MKRPSCVVAYVVFAVLWAVAGCSMTSPTAPPALVPTHATTAPSPSPVGVAVSPAVDDCQPGDVAIGRVSWQGATATMAGGFELVATGRAPCTVAGRAEVELLDASGHALAIQLHEIGGISRPVVLLPDVGSPLPDDGPVVGRADVLFYWTNWCGAAFAGSGTLRASIPGVGVVQRQFDKLSAPRCDAPGAPSVLAVGPIVPQDPDA